MLFVSCGNDDNSGAGTPTGKVDTTNYKNTSDAAGVQTRGTEAQKVFSSADEKFSAVSGSKFAALGLMPRSIVGDYDEEKCKDAYVLTNTTSQAGIQIMTYSCKYTDETAEEVSCVITEAKSENETKTSVTCDNGKEMERTTSVDNGSGEDSPSSDGNSGMDYSVLTEFNEGSKDCAGAIANIKKFYASARTELDNTLQGLKDKDKFAAASGAKMTIKETTDSNSAVAYEFSSDPAAKGMTVSGNMTAGASDDLIVITFDMKMAFDGSLMGSGIPGGAEFGDGSQGMAVPGDASAMKMATTLKHRTAADIKKQAIDFEDSGTFSMNDNSSSWTSVISVQGGDKPEVTADMNISTNAPDDPKKSVSMKMQVNIALVNDNTISMTGSGLIDGKAQVYSRTVTKGADGQCKVASETP
jgi:hypothetical protein